MAALFEALIENGKRSKRDDEAVQKGTASFLFPILDSLSLIRRWRVFDVWFALSLLMDTVHNKDSVPSRLSCHLSSIIHQERYHKRADRYHFRADDSLLLSELTSMERWRLLSFIKDVARWVSSYTSMCIPSRWARSSFFLPQLSFFPRLFDDHIDRSSMKKNRRKGFCYSAIWWLPTGLNSYFTSRMYSTTPQQPAHKRCWNG